MEQELTELSELVSEENISAAVKAVQAIDFMEAALFGIIIATSIALGLLLDRLIDRLPQRGWKTRIVDYLAPLLASIIAIILTISALSAYEHYKVATTILPLGLKLTVAWFAIRLVMLMSSKRTAGWFIFIVIVPITLLHLFDLWEPLTEMLKQWELVIGSVKITAFAVLKSIFAICVLFWVAGGISDLTERRLQKMRSLRASNRSLIMKMLQIVLYLVVFLIILQIMGVSLTALSVFGGALGVGLGFGLQKIASNFISGIILLFEKSIEIDDLIELENGVSGFVRHTGARYTLLETAEGKEMLIPNEDFITQRMVNWTYSNKRARAEIRINVGYESDLSLAHKIMLEAATAHPKCIKDPAPLCVLDSFGPSGVTILLYFWVADVTEGRLTPKSDVMMKIWSEFKANNINPAPPQEFRMAAENQLTVATPRKASPIE